MGEVAEMMLDGTLCQKCGGFAGEPVGFPRDCEDCRREHNRERGIAGANQVGKKRLARLRIVAERGGCSVGDAMAQIESLRRSGYVAVEGGVATITEAGRACLAAHAR